MAAGALDEYAKIQLQKPELMPGKDSFPANEIDENIAALGRLLDICASKRETIYQLESLALSTAHDFLAASRLEQSDERLAILAYRASKKMAQEAISEDDEKDITDRLEVIRNNRRSKLALHNVPGSSLNYGERIDLQREIYIQNLIGVFERFYALERIFSGRLGPFPSHITWSGRLDELVLFARSIIIALEYEAASEINAQITLGVRRDHLLDPDPAKSEQVLEWSLGYSPTDWAKNELPIILRLNITELILKSANKCLPAGIDWSNVKIVGFGVSLAARSMDYIFNNEAPLTPDTQRMIEATNSNISNFCSGAAYACDVTPPPQGGSKDSVTYWKPNRSPLNPVGFTVDRLSDPLNYRRLKNLNPIGTWVLRIDPKNMNPARDYANLRAIFSQYVADIEIALSIRFVPTGDFTEDTDEADPK